MQVKCRARAMLGWMWCMEVDDEMLDGVDACVVAVGAWSVKDDTGCAYSVWRVQYE